MTDPLTRRQVLLILGIALGLLTMIAVVAFSIGGNPFKFDEHPPYRIFYVEDMPCVKVTDIYGISCDWDRWEK